MADSRRAAGRVQFLGMTLRSSVVLNQLLLALVTLCGHLIELVLGQLAFDAPRVGGIALMAIATVAAVVVPWSRLPVWAAVAIPLLDVSAIMLLRMSSSTAGYGILWVLPAMWVAWSFGMFGAIAGSILIAGVYWISLALGTGAIAASALLLPVTVAGAAVVTALVARRARRQNILLTQQESLLREVVNAVDFGMERVASDGSVSLSNPARADQRRLVAAGSGRLFAGDGITELEPGDDPISRAHRGELIEGEIVWVGAPGEDRHAFSVTARPLGDEHADERIVTTLDVTEEILALRAREDLVASVSHELRTPLTSIIGYVDLAAEAPGLPEAARRSLEIANRNAERLLALITDILADGAAGRTGVEVRIVPVHVDLADIVRAAAEAAGIRAAEAGATIDTTGVSSAVTVADPQRIRQVVDNLLSNAIKYGRTGGHIGLECGIDHETVRIEVRDDGPGIPGHELPRIFDRFYRSSLVRGGSTHGNGLGLAISREIVRAHGGEITVESEEGLGSRFVVRLPLSA